MAIFLWICIVIVAFIIYRTIHRLFSITYFGIKALLGMIAGCLIAAYAIVVYLFSLISSHYIWAIVIAIVVLVLIGIVKSKSQHSSDSTPDSE